MSRPASRDRILAAALEEIAAGRELSVNAVAARAGVARQTVHNQYGGLRGLRAALASAGAPQPEPDVSARERLLAAAERLLSHPGGGEVAIDEIAGEAGLTKGAFYHYFPDRAAFLHEIARRVSPVDQILARIQLTEGMPDRDALIVIARAYYDAVVARADLFRNLVTNTARDPEIAQIVMNEILGRGAPLILGWFRERIAAGGIREVDPALAVQALFGPAFARILLGRDIFALLGRFGVVPATERVEAYVDMLLQGIGTETNGGRDSGDSSADRGSARPNATRPPGA